MQDHMFHQYEVLHSKLSESGVLLVDCNPVKSESVSPNPHMKSAVYHHPYHHRKTGQPHPSDISALYTASD